MLIKNGETVCIYKGVNNIEKVKIQAGKKLNYNFGIFEHNDIIGQEYGTTIYGRSKSKGSIIVLELTPELFTNSLSLETQIIYTADISLINSYIGKNNGDIVLECGSGSGSATLSFSRSVGSSGHVYSYESNSHRYLKIQQEFAEMKIKNVTFIHRNIYDDGLLPSPETKHNFADGILLDVPEPWLAIDKVNEALKPYCFLVCFCPCSEQIKKMTKLLKQNNYNDINCYETILRYWAAYTKKTIEKKRKKNHEITDNIESNASNNLHSQYKAIFEHTSNYCYPTQTRGHTGYILVARKPLDSENQLKVDVYNSISQFRPQIAKKNP